MTTLSDTDPAVKSNNKTNTKTKKRRFAMILEHVILSPAWAGLTGSAAKVYIAIALHAGVDGCAWPSLETLRIITKLNIRTVRRAIDELFQARLMLKHRGTGRQGTVYILTGEPGNANKRVSDAVAEGLPCTGGGSPAFASHGSTDPPNIPGEQTRITDQRTYHERDEEEDSTLNDDALKERYSDNALRKLYYDQDVATPENLQAQRACIIYRTRIQRLYAPISLSQYHSDVTCAENWWDEVIWPYHDPEGPARCAIVMKLIVKATTRTKPMAWMNDMIKRLDRGELRLHKGRVRGAMA